MLADASMKRILNSLSRDDRLDGFMSSALYEPRFMNTATAITRQLLRRRLPAPRASAQNELLAEAIRFRS